MYTDSGSPNCRQAKVFDFSNRPYTRRRAGYMGGNNGAEAAGDTKFVSGVAIPDLRIGVKASYGKWQAKVDVGFGYGKVGLKDTYIEYDFNSENLIRGGYFVPQFGLNSETSSSMKPSYEEPTSNEFFYANPRLLALMYEYSGDKYFAATTCLPRPLP